MFGAFSVWLAVALATHRSGTEDEQSIFLSFKRTLDLDKSTKQRIVSQEKDVIHIVTMAMSVAIYIYCNTYFPRVLIQRQMIHEKRMLLIMKKHYIENVHVFKIDFWYCK